MDDSKKHSFIIMIVEDEVNTRTVLEMLFEEEYQVILTTNGQEGLAKLQQLKQAEQPLPHLILTDMAMPGLDGVQLCQILKNTPEYKEIPIIMLSGSPASLAKGSGIQHFIAKPFKVTQLCQLVRQLIVTNSAKYSRQAQR